MSPRISGDRPRFTCQVFTATDVASHPAPGDCPERRNRFLTTSVLEAYSALVTLRLQMRPTERSPGELQLEKAGRNQKAETLSVPTTAADELVHSRSEEPVELPALAGRLRLSMIRFGRQLRRHDPPELSIAQVSGLASVVHAGPLGVGQLAELEGLPSPAATRLADKLEAAGLVVRQANPADRRGVQVVATQAGTDLLARRARAGDAWLAERLAALSESDRRALERAVAVLESLAAERPGPAPVAVADPGRTKELEA